MNLSKLIPNAVTRRVARQILVAQKNSPTILFGAGVVGVVATTVLACRATLKVDEVLEQHQKTMLDINHVQHANYSDLDRKHDKTVLYIQSVVKVTKLYGPAIIVGTASIAALAGAHNILSKRNAALTVAYAAIEKGFAEYRSRVVEEYGEDKDRELRYGKDQRTIVEDTDKGPKKVVLDTHAVRGPSIYAKVFDEFNLNWDPRPELNVVFLRGQQMYATDKLRAKGHIFLNEVYDALAFPRTQAGQVMGWVLEEGDDYVDFNIWSDPSMTRFHDFMTNRENGILLDFNVTNVYDHLKKRS